MKRIFFVLCLFFSITSLAETGILFIAHGTMNHGSGHGLSSGCTPHHPSEWEGYVLSSINEMKNELPHKAEVAFGMWESHCFDEAISRLESRLAAVGKTLDHLVVFPLFISSHSEVIEMQKFIFRKRPDMVLPIPYVRQTRFQGQITYMKALDYDPHVSLILANRFHHLVHLAKDQGVSMKNMELVLVMHGPVDDRANIKWMEMGESYNKDIMYLFPVKKSHVLSLRDDAPAETRDRMTAELRGIISNADKNGRVALILPLLISRGGIDAGIIHRLRGLSYIWSGDAILPDSKLKDVIMNRLRSIK